MQRKKNSQKVYHQTVKELFDLKAILAALDCIAESSYPASALIDMARKKLKTVFYNVVK